MTGLVHAIRLLTFLCIVSILFSIAASETFLAAAFLLWLPVMIREGWKQRRLPLDWPPFFGPIRLFVVATILSVWFSADPHSGMPAIRKLPLFFLCFLVTRFFDQAWVERTYFALFGVGSLAGVYAMVQFGEKWWHYQHTQRAADDPTLIFRVHAFMGHWMTFSGEQLLVFASLLAFLAIFPIRRRWRWTLVTALISISIALSFTRSVWLAGGIVFVAALLISHRRIVWVFPLVLLLLVMALPHAVHERLDSFLDTGFSSNAARIEMARAGWKMFREHPWFGVGPQRVGIEFKAILDARGVTRPPFYIGHLHNNLIQLAAERGVFALTAFIWLMIELFIRLWRGSHVLADELGVRAVYMAGVFSIVALVVAGMFEFNFGDSEVLILFLFLISAPYAMHPGTMGALPLSSETKARKNAGPETTGIGGQSF